MEYFYDVVCETPFCPNQNNVINVITFESDDSVYIDADDANESFVESWRPEAEDVCASCHKTGVLQPDPRVSFEDELRLKVESNDHNFRDEGGNCYFTVRVDKDGTVRTISHDFYMKAFTNRV